MNKDKIVDYVLNTPGNTNPSVLISMLESYGGGSNINVPEMREVFCKVKNDTRPATTAAQITICYLTIDENNNLVTVEKDISEQGETIYCIPSPVNGFESGMSMFGAGITSVEVKKLNGEDTNFEEAYLESFEGNFWGTIRDNCQLIFHVVVYG